MANFPYLTTDDTHGDYSAHSESQPSVGSADFLRVVQSQLVWCYKITGKGVYLPVMYIILFSQESLDTIYMFSPRHAAYIVTLSVGSGLW